MPNCRSICKKYQAEKPMRQCSIYSYAKRCTVCEIMIKDTFDRCPCCKNRLRSKPKYTIRKENLIQDKTMMRMRIVQEKN